jgi:hypothetical protein
MYIFWWWYVTMQHIEEQMVELVKTLFELKYFLVGGYRVSEEDVLGTESN